ncbi:hypothetical protein [Siminovitchia fortis]|uniref:hypothetical protein n=1 Tax=Siminovitchia fortis TaxID=254758 RepID=UPI0011A26020|nr:hypothetical protein [Siminovitchia fortis]
MNIQSITPDQYAAIKEIREFLHQVAEDKRDRYVLEVTDYNGKRPEIVSRGEYLEFVVTYVKKQLSVFDNK